jgi:hypothetical protein
MRLLRYTLFLSVLSFSLAARAQSVRWESDESSLGTAIQLVFQDCEPDGDPQLPSIPDTTLTLSGTATSMNIVNMSMTRSVILTYAVQARRGGPLQIPAFTVKTNKGPVRVAAYNGAAPSITADSVAISKLLPERNTVWAGEVFGLDYQIDAARRNNPQFDPTLAFDWEANPLVAETWSKPDLKETTVDDQRHIVLTYHTRAFAKAPGSITLQAAHQVVHVQTGAVGFGLFSQARMEPISITSNQPALQVRPLPAPPAGFNGAVGQFKLTSKVVPKEAGVGEPVTWTLELSGTGNWPDIAGLPAREVSKDFQVIQPKAKRTPAEGKLFDVTLSEDVVLVPTKSGSYTLPPVAFTFFNPQTGSYESARTEAATITINAPAAPQLSAGGDRGAPTEKNAPTAVPKPAAKPPAPPAAPSGIPRDPIAGGASAAVPLTMPVLAGWLMAPVACLFAWWLALAWRRAVRTDPLRVRREAHARLTALLAQMRNGGTGRPPTAAQLLEWQHEAAVLWGISHAAPGAAAIDHANGSYRTPRAATQPGDDADQAARSQWAALWREADRALYGAAATLPGDWLPRAEAALASKPVPRLNPLRLFLPQNLLAFAAAIAVVVTLAPSRSSAASVAPDAAYRGGEFADAEKGWRDSVSRQPTDWIARYNLSLALAQQDHIGEAAAQSVAAFVQQPGNAAVRWNFEFLAQKAGFTPAPLAAFLKEGPASAIAALAGPAVWQRLLIFAAFVVALGLGWLLANAYSGRSRLQAWAAGIVATLGVVAGIVSIFGVVAYGDTADRRAVVTWQAGVLRSIPTEADTTQKTTALPAGSVAIVDKTFLAGRWDRLVFSNGQTGWVRQEDVVPLWSK